MVGLHESRDLASLERNDDLARGEIFQSCLALELLGLTQIEFLDKDEDFASGSFASRRVLKGCAEEKRGGAGRRVLEREGTIMKGLPEWNEKE